MKYTTSLATLLSSKKTLAVVGVLAVIVFVVVRTLGNSGDEGAEAPAQNLPMVDVTTVTELEGSTSLSLIGTVRAFTEANITSERSGRVTSVNARLGQQVPAGFVIATLENSAERAAVTQAQGAYQAALAASAQTTLGVGDAETALRTASNNAVSTYRSAYNTVNNAIYGSIDTLFANPRTSIPGLRLDGRGSTATLNSERVAFESLLSEWRQRSSSITNGSNLDAELEYAKANLDRVIAMVDTFLVIIPQQTVSAGGYTEAEIQGLTANFSGLRSSLIATRSSLEGAETGLITARDNLTRARLSASGSSASSADAQITQALGALQAAQANLAKTILRTPIAGTVNTLSVAQGDFVNGMSSVAIVANNNALEVVTFVNEREKELLAVGDTVIINNSVEGIVSAVAPAVDPDTRKIEVRIALVSEDILNGDTVRVTREVTATTTDSTILVPLTAIRFEGEEGYMMTVENGVLTRLNVELGDPRNGLIEVRSGIDTSTPFVRDVRGLSLGATVAIKEN